ncbi:zinc transporter [Rhodobacteraceae bacterium CCMM004]|nr:zinc transporter [Rhodobacteraceae bacterium CCMM004]
MAVVLILVVCGALVLGALWGAYGRLPEVAEGVLVSVAGGALIVSLMLELVEPSAESLGPWGAMGFVMVGAVVFTVLDHLVDEVLGAENGNGMLLAVTLDGVPESLALGAVLIGVAPAEVAALAAGIFLSNLPEAAGGARRMRAAGYERHQILWLWSGAAALLAAAALAGNFWLDGARDTVIAGIQCFAAGAVVASLITEVFPSAFKRGHHFAGVGVAAGLAIAYLLHDLGK